MIGAIPTHIRSGNQETVPLPRPQQEALVLRFSGFDTTVLATRGSQDVSA